MHILVVEDERKMAALLRRVLIEERHTVDLAYDGPGGLDLALSDTYDVIILDLMLPGLDGIELCRRMRAERITTPILMLTARKAIDDRVKGLKTGADDYLVKPFAMEELLARIEALLRRRERAFREVGELRVGELSLDLAVAAQILHSRARGGGICAPVPAPALLVRQPAGGSGGATGSGHRHNRPLASLRFERAGTLWTGCADGPHLAGSSQ